MIQHLWRFAGRIGGLLLVLNLLASCVVGQEAQPPQLRVLTYNIHHGRGMDGKFDYQRLADIIKKLKPDVVALQEVDRGVQRSGRVDQSRRLGELTGMHYAFGNALYYQGGEYGEAILSRFPVDQVRAHHLPFRPQLEPRTALAVRIQPGGGLPPFVFVGTHLCHEREAARIDQTKRLMALFSPEDMPVLMAGDFNARPGSEPMKVLLDSGWVDAIAPRSRIDYVLFREQDPWQVAETVIVDEPVASDHDPVLAVLQWHGETPDADKGDGPAQTKDNGRRPPLARYSFDRPMERAVADGLGSGGGALRLLPGQPARQIEVDPGCFQPSRDFSVQFWVRTTSGDDQRFVLVSQKPFPDNSLSSQKNPGWVWYLSHGTLAWNMGSGGRRITYERDNGEYLPLNDGRWHQLAMTHDSTAGLIRLYYDGRNVAIYNVRDSGGFDFSSSAPLMAGWKESNAAAADVLPSISEGAAELKKLVKAYRAAGLPDLEPDELVQLVIEPEKLINAKRAALAGEKGSEKESLPRAPLESADLDVVKQITSDLMDNPYTVHQAPSFMEVAPLLQLYDLAGGQITINRSAAAKYAARERLDAPRFDLDELSAWDRKLTAEEVREAYLHYFVLPERGGGQAPETLTVGVWNIYHGGIHHTVENQGWDSRQAIIDLLRREGIDILLMQETYSSGDYVAADLGFYYATTIDWDNLNQGANISVLSRYPIEEVTVPPGSAFMNVAAKIRLGGDQAVYAMSNWYGMRNFPDVFRFHQHVFADTDRVPVLFGGDFNAVPHTDGGDSPASQQLLATGFRDAFRSLFPDSERHPGFTHRSGRRIDQLYYKGRSLRNTSTHVLSEWPSLFPSDHYLIKAVFELDALPEE